MPGAHAKYLASQVRDWALTYPANRGFLSPLFIGKNMYAVIETGSKQYRVAAGDTLEVERLEGDAGKAFTFDRVLMLSNDGKFHIGAPLVKGGSVVADIVEHIRGPKKIAFKMKRRKGYHRTVGHRQELTVVKITEIKA